MKSLQLKNKKYQDRKKRVRAKIVGSKDCPRFSVFRSNAHIYGQLVDDLAGKTLVHFSDISLKIKKNVTKTEAAALVGEEIAKLAKAKKIKKIVFDRNGFKYHGRVKSLADGARKGGLDF